MAGTMSKECLAAIWEVVLHIGELQGVLGAEGTKQGVLTPEDWLQRAVALPTDEGVQHDFDLVSEWIAVDLGGISEECMDAFPKFPSAKLLAANGAAEDFQNPFAGETQTLAPNGETTTDVLMLRPGPTIPRPGGVATDAYQLWNQLNEVQDAIMDWVNEIFLEPSRYATANSR